MIKPVPLFISLISLLFVLFNQPTWAANEHEHGANHSDVLLFLLGEKIALKKLQSAFSKGLPDKEKAKNLNHQKQRLNKALAALNEFMARPESRYPNMQMYHESLKTRGAMLHDYSLLLNGFYQALSMASMHAVTHPNDSL